jgi:hypothetical protein
MKDRGQTRRRPVMVGVLLVLLLILLHQPVVALSATDPLGPATDAAMKLVQFCIDPKAGLDKQALSTLVDYVLGSKETKEYALPKSMECTGAYYEFDTKIAFPRFIEYSYNPLIPAVITRPSSVRYSLWAASGGEIQQLPNTWKPVPRGGAPVIIHSIQHESDTPDLNTGVYHEYDLKRTLILLNHRGHQVLVSISKQINKSNVGKKAVIVGNDYDWNYYYSREPGTTKTGLGWVKSYIFDYFSVGVYMESTTTTPVVKSGVFQWLSAGWSGINFVKSSHILRGMKRFARDNRMVLESPRLPAPDQLISVYQWLSNLPAGDLVNKHTALLQAQRSSAIQVARVSGYEGEEPLSLTNTTKEQMVEELMLDYLKTALGKESRIF